MLERWEHKAENGPLIRGWRTVPRGLPVICFLHGNGLCAMAYWPMLQNLIDAYDIVLMDIPGHGASEASDRFRGWEAEATHCYSAWQGISSDYSTVKKHWVAHSYGAVLVVFILARSGREFASAVLLDPVFFPPKMLLLGWFLSRLGLLKYHKLARGAANRRDHWSDKAAAKQHLGKRRVFAKWNEACLDAYLEHGFKEAGGGVGLCCNRSLEAKNFSTMPYRLPRALKRLQVKCTVYTGTNSYDFVVAALPDYSSGNKYLEHHEIAGSHNFMLERPVEAARFVRTSLVSE